MTFPLLSLRNNEHEYIHVKLNFVSICALLTFTCSLYYIQDCDKKLLLPYFVPFCYQWSICNQYMLQGCSKMLIYFYHSDLSVSLTCYRTIKYEDSIKFISVFQRFQKCWIIMKTKAMAKPMDGNNLLGRKWCHVSWIWNRPTVTE